MKQFLLTMAGVFAGLALFFVGVPFLLISLAMNATHPAATAAASTMGDSTGRARELFG